MVRVGGVKIMYSSVGVTRVQQGLVSSHPNVMGNYLQNKKVKIIHSSVGVTRVQQVLQNKVSMAIMVNWAGGRRKEGSSSYSAGRRVS